MIREVQYNSQLYQIDTLTGDITSICRRSASGVLAGVMRDLGKDIQSTTHYVVPSKERDDLIVFLGWRFSKSKMWRKLFDYAYARSEVTNE